MSTTSTNDEIDETIGESENHQIETNVDEERTPQSPAVLNFQTPHSKKRRLSKLNKVESAIEKLQKLSEGRSSMSNKPRADEVDVFGTYVAAQLRDLPLKNRLTCQDKIQSMLTKERLKLLDPPQADRSPMLSAPSSYYGDSEGDATENQFLTEGSFVYRNLS